MKILMGDFETTVYTGQTRTDVWASACVELYTEDVKIFGSIKAQWEYYKSLKESLIIYYHNLKFDGAFWLHFFLTETKLKQALYIDENNVNNTRFMSEKEMPINSFRYNISNMGQWYSITVKLAKRTITFRDSLKLLPFSVSQIGRSFKTKHQKTDIEYSGFRYPNCEITEKEKEYIANDVLVVKEALEIMFDEGHKKLTIGSCCLAEFKKIIGDKKDYESLFPQLYDIDVKNCEHSLNDIANNNIQNIKDFEGKTAGDYIRKSYKGGWCYLAKGKENKIFTNGITLDVNSLYPSMMSSESGNLYPVGRPTFWCGNYIPTHIQNDNYYYFIRFKTRFYLKEGYLPTVQIKGNLLYKYNEWLETSDIFNKQDGNYYRFINGCNDEKIDTSVTLTMTCTDFKLFCEHYTLEDFEILDGCYFTAKIGIFDEYIEKYKQKKLTSTGALRELAKLFLNNLYGKMASSTNSSFKVAFIKEDNSLGFYEVTANEKEAGYIAIGSAITSYARNFTIRTAQKNYYGKDKRGFIYADTDSIHCDLTLDELKGINLHDKNFCCWKHESSWVEGLFVRQKTYIEHTYNAETKEENFDVKCAGMPESCKKLFVQNITNQTPEIINEHQKDFFSHKLELSDFKIGLKIWGKLMPKQIEGGVVLTETTYEMR